MYSSTKFGIIKPWTNIPWPRRFLLAFWQTSKQIYRKFKYREKVFGEFQALPRFPRKMVLNSLTEFGILKPRTNIQSLIRFYLGFWQTSKQIYQKLQYRENVFEELKSLSRFSWKMVLYSSTKFGILKPWTNIQSFTRFDLGFWQTLNKIYRKLQYTRKFLESIKFALLSQKHSFVFVKEIWHSKALNQYSIGQKIRFRVLRVLKANSSETPI